MHAIRAQIRSMLNSVGYEPVMSDQADVIYDPRIHTHSSCIREVENCDALVVIIGSRFGGSIVPKALELVDMDRIGDISRADRFGDDKNKISITQAEVVKAIQSDIPIFAFVDTGVMRDHLTYEKNKNKPIISEIEFSSIDKVETAPYIFEFINFLRLRNENNSIFEFSRFEDIENQLKKQWSGLFQRLLHEQRSKSMEGRRIDNLSSQIADLKAAVLGSISSTELKETAKGAIRFRQLIEFVTNVSQGMDRDPQIHLKSLSKWHDMIKNLGILEIRQYSLGNRFGANGCILVMDNNTHFRTRVGMRAIERIGIEWNDFIGLSPESKDAIIAAVQDSLDGRVIPLFRHFNEPYSEEDADNPDEDAYAPRKPATIFLTAEKFIEEAIKMFLTSSPQFSGMTFLVDVNKENVRISRSKGEDGGPMDIFEYAYTIPNGGSLSSEIDRIKKRALTEIPSAAPISAENLEKTNPSHTASAAN
jgi:hypothetical protein